MRRPIMLALVLASAAFPMRARASGPPPACTPVPLSTSKGSGLCFDGLLVTETSNVSAFPGSALGVHEFFVTAGAQTRKVRVAHWWPLGTPTAGMVVTLWGSIDADGTIAATRWIERTHGAGPAPEGPYPYERLLDLARGAIPEHRMVWTLGTTFLTFPQYENFPYDGDGDVHVQMLSPCPAGGLTAESTPEMRGYVDHAGEDTISLSGTPLEDSLVEDTAGDPPLGVPVMVLGATRYDYQYGWWELHPIRAWRLPTADEIKRAASDCGTDPVPHFDPSVPLPAMPYGIPACGELPVGGVVPPGYSPCVPICQVGHTAIDQPETLDGPCDGITPEITRSQEEWFK